MKSQISACQVFVAPLWCGDVQALSVNPQFLGVNWSYFSLFLFNVFSFPSGSPTCPSKKIIYVYTCIYHPVIKHGTGKSMIKIWFSMAKLSICWTFHCHVSLLEGTLNTCLHDRSRLDAHVPHVLSTREITTHRWWVPVDLTLLTIEYHRSLVLSPSCCQPMASSVPFL